MIVLVSFVGAHAHDAGGANPVPTAGPAEGHFLSLPPGGRRLEGVGIDVVPSRRAPRLSLAEAVSVFAPYGGNSGSDSPNGSLVTATNGDWGFPGGLYQNSFTDRLSWLITYPDARPELHGPSMTADQRAKILASITCSNIGLVDATTGEFLRNTQYCS